MKPIILLTGSNEVFRKEYSDKLIKNIPREEITIYYAEETASNVIFAQCIQNSLFGSNNIVIVRGVEEMSAQKREGRSTKKEFAEAFHKYIDDHNHNTTLIVEWDKPSEKIKKAVRNKKDFEIKAFKKIYKDEIIVYIRRKFQDENIHIENGVVELLAELANDDIGQVSMFVRILCDYVSDTKKLSVEEVHQALSRSGNMQIFDFLGAFFMRDTKKALYGLTDLRNTKGQSVLAINTMILRTAKQMWGYFAMSRTSHNLVQALKISPYQLKFLRDYAKHIDMKFVSGAIDLVKRVEHIAKSMVEDFAYLEIEKFILEQAK